MLEKANKLKSNDPYIVDSLGWALFKLKRYKDSKKYLQQAVQLMPADPIINDHYGDVLWKNGNSLQARYYWNYVLNLDETEEDLKQIVKNKLLSVYKEMILRSFSKVNLSLNINKKLKHELHDIQSYFCLIDLSDQLKIKIINGKKILLILRENLLKILIKKIIQY